MRPEDHLGVVVASGPGYPAQDGRIAGADIAVRQFLMLDQDGRLPVVGDPATEVMSDVWAFRAQVMLYRFKEAI